MSQTTAQKMQHRVRHDVDQPLFGVRLLLEQIRTEDTAARIDAIGEGVDLLGADLRRLLRYALVRENLIPISSEPLVGICERCVAALAPIAKIAQVEVSLLLDGVGDNTVPHAIALEYAFTSLLENAIEFSPGGRVSIHGGQRDGEISLSVTDTGNGLPDVDRERMFEAFETFNAQASSRPQRWGLGLATARLAIDQAEGKLEIAPTPINGITGTQATILLRPTTPGSATGSPDEQSVHG